MAQEPTAKDVTHHDVSWPEARRRGLQAGEDRAQHRAVVTVPLDRARGLVLGQDMTSYVDLPSFDTAAMDGWATRGPGPWNVVGEASAGDRPKKLDEGQALRISTGAVVPAAAGVLRSERGTEVDAVVTLRSTESAPSLGTDTRSAGEEVRSGEVVLRAGTVLTPPALGLAAACGHDTVPVRRAPTVDVVILGEELVDRGIPASGKVRDALSPQLPGWIEAMHAAFVGALRIRDSLDATMKAVSSVGGDVVVTTGGTARGPKDHVRASVGQLGGRWLVDGVAVRPGHPMKLAVLPDGRLWIALPGNPLAAVSALITIGEPLLAALSGRPAPRDMNPDEVVRRPLAQAVEVSPGAHRLIPAYIHEGAAHPVLRRGPAMLSGLADADVFIVVPPGPEPLAVGADVDLLPLPWGTGLVV